MSNDFLNEIAAADAQDDDNTNDAIVSDEVVDEEFEDEFEDDFDDIDEVEEVYASEWHTTSALVLLGSYLVILLFWLLYEPEGETAINLITSAQLPADIAVFVLITSGFSFLCSVIGMIADWYCKKDGWSLLVTFGPLLPLALLALGGVSIARKGDAGTLFTKILNMD